MAGNPEARKRAETEYNALSRRGWEVSGSDMLTALVTNWEKRLAKDEYGVNKYVIAYGNDMADELADAEAGALHKAREQIAGPMIMYFQSWNMAMEGKGEITANEALAVRDAVNATEKAIRQAYCDLNIPADLSMSRLQRGRYEAHIRIVYSQMELRQLAKEIIAAELQRNCGWDKAQAFRVMEYPK